MLRWLILAGGPSVGGLYFTHTQAGNKMHFGERFIVSTFVDMPVNKLDCRILKCSDLVRRPWSRTCRVT